MVRVASRPRRTKPRPEMVSCDRVPLRCSLLRPLHTRPGPVAEVGKNEPL